MKDREHELAKPLGGLASLNLGNRLKIEAAALLSVRLELARSELARGETMTSDADLAQITTALNDELRDLEAISARRSAQAPA